MYIYFSFITLTLLLPGTCRKLSPKNKNSCSKKGVGKSHHPVPSLCKTMSKSPLLTSISTTPNDEELALSQLLHTNNRYPYAIYHIQLHLMFMFPNIHLLLASPYSEYRNHDHYRSSNSTSFDRGR